MSHPELRRHALRIEELAFQGALDQLGLTSLPDGRIVDKTNMIAVPADVISGFRDQCTVIPALFEPFLAVPDPGALDGMHQKLIAAARRLATVYDSTDPIHGIRYLVDPGMNRTKMVDETLTNWRGEAGQEFKGTLREIWPAIMQNQFGLVSVVRSLWWISSGRRF